MVKVIAQMRNPRRGHDAQGKLKKVRLDRYNEGYANFLAPMRMKKIEHLASTDETYKELKLYDNALLKPETVTYLTPEWDEMVPFPNSESSQSYMSQYFAIANLCYSLEDTLQRLWPLRL